MVAISLNLRPALVAVGPITAQLQDDTGLSAAAISLLSTLPLLCFGVFAFTAPAFGRLLGLERALFLALLLLIAGTLVRLAPPTVALFAGSAIAGTGIAIANVLVPGIVKRDFPNHTGPMMAVYSVALNGGAMLASGATIPVQRALHLPWREALAVWAVLALVAVVLWLPQLRGTTRPEVVRDAARSRVWHSRLAWSVALFMGMQSIQFYALAAWLPTLLHDHGMETQRAGLMFSLLGAAAIGAAVVTPVVAARRPRQRALVAVTAAGIAAGLVGLLVAPVDLAVLWMILLGIGTGTGVSLALTLFVLRTRTGEDAAALSGMAQTVGYLIAATGPLAVGAMHDATGHWDVPVLVLIALLVPLTFFGWGATDDQTIDEDSGQARLRRTSSPASAV